MSEKKEYIERGALLSFMRDNQQLDYGWAYRIVRGFPAADVEPVVRGEWITVPSSDLSTGRAYKCSVCEKMRYGSYLPPYCQCCGAHMERSGSGDK